MDEELGRRVQTPTWVGSRHTPCQAFANNVHRYHVYAGMDENVGMDTLAGQELSLRNATNKLFEGRRPEDVEESMLLRLRNAEREAGFENAD